MTSSGQNSKCMQQVLKDLLGIFLFSWSSLAPAAPELKQTSFIHETVLLTVNFFLKLQIFSLAI